MENEYDSFWSLYVSGAADRLDALMAQARIEHVLARLAAEGLRRPSSEYARHQDLIALLMNVRRATGHKFMGITCLSAADRCTESGRESPDSAGPPSSRPKGALPGDLGQTISGRLLEHWADRLRPTAGVGETLHATAPSHPRLPFSQAIAEIGRSQIPAIPPGYLDLLVNEFDLTAEVFLRLAADGQVAASNIVSRLLDHWADGLWPLAELRRQPNTLVIIVH